VIPNTSCHAICVVIGCLAFWSLGFVLELSRVSQRGWNSFRVRGGDSALGHWYKVCAADCHGVSLSVDRSLMSERRDVHERVCSHVRRHRCELCLVWQGGFVVKKPASGPVLARSLGPEAPAALSLVFRVPRDRPQLKNAVSELALASVVALSFLCERPAHFRLEQRVGGCVGRRWGLVSFCSSSFCSLALLFRFHPAFFFAPVGRTRRHCWVGSNSGVVWPSCECVGGGFCGFQSLAGQLRVIFSNHFIGTLNEPAILGFGNEVGGNPAVAGPGCKQFAAHLSFLASGSWLVGVLAPWEVRGGPFGLGSWLCGLSWESCGALFASSSAQIRLSSLTALECSSYCVLSQVLVLSFALGAWLGGFASSGRALFVPFGVLPWVFQWDTELIRCLGLSFVDDEATSLVEAGERLRFEGPGGGWSIGSQAVSAGLIDRQHFQVQEWLMLVLPAAPLRPQRGRGPAMPPLVGAPLLLRH
jgi:hypothetical protein